MFESKKSAELATQKKKKKKNEMKVSTLFASSYLVPS